MPVLTNKITHRKSPKRRKESHAEDQEESSGSPAPERRNSSVCEDDDDDVDSVASSYSSASEHGSSEEEEEEEAGSKWAELGLSLKRNDLCRSPRRAPVSDRSLNVENTQVLRKNVAESIKESSRSENDFVYLNNLYTFTAVAGLSKRNSHKHTPSKESEQRVKGLQRLRSIDEEAAYEELLMETKGFAIKKMIGDGNCLFRSVADQLYGDQEKHAQIREDCMDYMVKKNK